MNPLRPHGVLGALLLLPVSALGAQLSEPGAPASDWAELTPAPTHTLPAVDVEALLAEDADTDPFPLRYGDVLETDLGLEQGGVWDAVPENDALVWRARIHSPGAESLGVVFTEYEIPVGGQVFLYTDDKSVVLGAYTDSNNNVNGGLGIEPIPGDAVTIEYVQQPWATEAPRLHVGQVIHDYKNVFNLIEVAGGAGHGADGGCGLVGINCPEGAPYQTVKRSVMRTLVGGGLCSASLLNNTAVDGTPYMLTANHCGNMTFGQFLFEYEQPTCGTSFGPTSSTLSGAVKLASSATYDSQLYRLNTTPPDSYDPFWAGWSRSSSSGAPVTTIGHGGGGPKNMAIDNSGAITSGVQWQVFWNTGYIIGGNSGGPLFDGNKRVIGPACCVNTFTCGVQTAWYGRLGLFWNAFNLEQWLDPAGTGALAMDGFDPFASPPSLTGIAPDTVQVFGGGEVTLSGTGLLGTTTVHVGGTALSSPGGFTVVDDSTITFTPPEPAALGTVQVTAEKPAGASNPVDLTYEATDPAKLTATATTVTGLNAAFNFGAQPNDLWFLFVAVDDSSTIPVEGFDFLASSLFLTSGNLSAVGKGNVAVTVPSGLAGSTVFSQVALLDDATFALVDVTNVAQTFILL